MAIVEMSKIRLIGLSYEREKILNAIHKCSLVELKSTEELEDTFIVAAGDKADDLSSLYEKTVKTIEVITAGIQSSKKEEFYKTAASELDSVFVSYDEFMAANGYEADALKTIGEIEKLCDKLAENKTEITRLNNFKLSLLPYKDMEEKFSEFSDTELTSVFLGLIDEGSFDKFSAVLSEEENVYTSVHAENVKKVVSVICLKEKSLEISEKLNEIGFISCPFDFDMTAKEKLSETDSKIHALYGEISDINKEICNYSSKIKKLKVYADYVRFSIEKLKAEESFRRTESTFILEGYLPKEKQVEVSAAINGASENVFIEFSAPSKDETPPTLLKNNKVVGQAEFVTNMYSAPDYREIDPNVAVWFFFMIFFGIIMADVGYGVLLIVIGIIMSSRIKVENGTKKLMKIFVSGGFFTIIFGLLFGSFFGVSLYHFLPDPTSGNSNDVIVILLGCLALGILQISVGYILNAINAFRRRDFVSGIFDSLLWVVFFIGLVFAAFNFLMQYFNIPIVSNVKEFFDMMTMPGIIMLGGALLLIVVTAGRKEKGFGKFTKGFGALYGIINLLSDILSYARLFGLMLSGMIIAQQFNIIGLGLMSSPVGYVFGPLVMIIGHAFNIAMGVLGAYIHDCRLQYIEFFSKFYTGEGELFKPLGSDYKYVYLKH